MTDEAQTYNGWANYPTWNIALWINNDQGWQASVFEDLRALIADNPDPDDATMGVTAYDAGAAIRTNVETVNAYTLTNDPDGDIPASLVSDLLGWALDSADWSELGAAFLTDLADQS